MNNSIPICRSILTHWVYQDAEYLKVWLTMLSRARYIDEPKTIVYEKSLCTLNYGQFIFGRKAWCKQTGISEQRLRGLLKKLLADNMLILKQKTNHFSIYEITNYSKFNQQQTLEPQGIEGIVNQQLTISQPSDNQQLTTNEEGIKKDKEILIEDFFKIVWGLYPSKKGVGQVSKSRKAELYKVGLDELTNCINAYKKHVEAQRRTGFDLKYQNGSTFFNSGYKDYLESKVDKPIRKPITVNVVESDYLG